MRIPLKDWYSYINRLAAISKEASRQMQEYALVHGYEDGEAIVEYAYALATKYGEATAALACEMYDAIAAAQMAGVPEAEPAPTATYSETAKAVYGTMKNQHSTVADTVGRLVKQAGADTMLQNAQRDHAQFAWIPMGDTCAFCMTLASRGWQYQSKKTLKNGHAEHIHANCDCEYCVRFDSRSTVEGYNPDRYLQMYENAEGNTPQEKINTMRRNLAEQKRKLEESGEKKIGVGN